VVITCSQRWVALVDVLPLQVTCALGFDTVPADDHRRRPV